MQIKYTEIKIRVKHCTSPAGAEGLGLAPTSNICFDHLIEKDSDLVWGFCGDETKITISWAKSPLRCDFWDGNSSKAEVTTILVPSASRFEILVLSTT